MYSVSVEKGWGWDGMMNGWVEWESGWWLLASLDGLSPRRSPDFYPRSRDFSVGKPQYVGVLPDLGTYSAKRVTVLSWMTHPSQDPRHPILTRPDLPSTGTQPTKKRSH